MSLEIDGIDGRNMWNEITKNLPSRRESFIYSIDPLGNLGCQNETEAISFCNLTGGHTHTHTHTNSNRINYQDSPEQYEFK